MKTERKTEREFGWEYASDMADSEPVDVDTECGRSVDIPPDDYRAMVQAGINNPDPRKYWDGYNSYCHAG